jgi:hypothetical protein
MQDEKAYYAELDNDLHVAKFPEDFTDWLLDEGREFEAKEFMAAVKKYKASTLEDEWTLDDLLDMARYYAPVVVLEEELRQPTYAQAVRLLEAAERLEEPTSRDEPVRWDQEAALVNQALADSAPLSMDRPEYEDVTVWVDDHHSVTDIVMMAARALIDDEKGAVARQFLREVGFVLAHNANQWDLFKLTWSYVTIVPEIGSQNERIVEMYG